MSAGLPGDEKTRRVAAGMFLLASMAFLYWAASIAFRLYCYVIY